jgi:hypothetical protein
MEYFYLGIGLVKRRDPIEVKASEETAFVSEEEVKAKLKATPQREHSKDSQDIILEFIEHACKEEGADNLCFVAGCKGLIADVNISLFCTQHNMQAYNQDCGDLFPSKRGYVFPPRRPRAVKPKGK